MEKRFSDHEGGPEMNLSQWPYTKVFSNENSHPCEWHYPWVLSLQIRINFELLESVRGKSGLCNTIIQT